MPKVAAELGPLDVKRLAHPGGKGNVMVPVGGVAGLYLQLAPKGGRTWILRMLVGGRRRDIGLGGFPTVTLAQARDKAREARDKVERGVDPVEERKAAKAKLVEARRNPAKAFLMPHRSSTSPPPHTLDSPTVPNVIPTELVQRPTRQIANTAGLSIGELAKYIPSPEELRVMFGMRTDRAANLVATTALMGLGESGTGFRDLLLAMGAELEPQDAIEAILVTQSCLAHVGYMTAMGRMADATNDQARESYSRIAARMNQAFLNQIDALRRHRARSSPAVSVGQVTVNEGGQAIVGTVHAKVSHEK